MAHGGSLSINPNTGLPEAGFLKNILPTVLGIALTPFMGPMAAGLTVGGIETVRTGDIGKGFLAGLGAFGGANLAGSLALTGAATAASAAPGVSEAVASGALPQASITAASATPSVAPTIGETALGASFAPAGTSAGGSFLAANPVTAATTMGAQLPTGYAAMGEGARALGTEAGRATFMDQAGGLTGLAKTAGMAGAPMLSAAMTPEPVAMPQDEKREVPQYTQSRVGPRFPSNEQIRTDSSEFSYFDAPQYTRISPSAPVETPRFGFGEGTADFLAMSDEERRRQQVPTYMLRAAEGGVTALAKGGVPMLEDGGFVLTKKAVDGLGKGDNKKGQENARRGLGAIPIKGPGTGTSDSIKTSIEGKRPALVSNGEAYVPKKQVAKRGGAKAFYALMDKAEKQARQAKRA
jgi:hypothetical protein